MQQDGRTDGCRPVLSPGDQNNLRNAQKGAKMSGKAKAKKRGAFPHCPAESDWLFFHPAELYRIFHLYIHTGDVLSCPQFFQLGRF